MIVSVGLHESGCECSDKYAVKGGGELEAL